VNNRLEYAAPATVGTRILVESIAAYRQDERLWLELVSDPKTRHWSLCVRDALGQRVRSRLGLDQALERLACGARVRARLPQSRKGA
jgi:hypothetical protein